MDALGDTGKRVLQILEAAPEPTCPWCGAVEGRCLCRAERAAQDARNAWAREVERALSLAGVPPRIAPATVHSQPHARLEAIRAWLPVARDRFLVFTGPTGSGKSWAAFVALQLAAGALPAPLDIRALTPPRFVWAFVPDLMRALRSNLERAGELWEGVASADVVVLDDLGAERGTEWETDNLSGLVSRRYDYCRPTIVTSNLTPEDFVSANPRLASRLLSGVLLRVSGKDKRLSPHPPSEE